MPSEAEIAAALADAKASVLNPIELPAGIKNERTGPSDLDIKNAQVIEPKSRFAPLNQSTDPRDYSPEVIERGELAILSTAQAHRGNSLAIPAMGLAPPLLAACEVLILNDRMRIVDLSFVPQQNGKAQLWKIFVLTPQGLGRLQVLRIKYGDPLGASNDG